MEKSGTLENFRIMDYRSPILVVRLDTMTLRFYDMHSYDKWQEQTPNYRQWKHNYIMGLGHHTENVPSP